MNSRSRAFSRRISAATVVAGITVALAACATGDRNDRVEGQAVRRVAAAGEAASLREVCPANVVVQSNWWPQAEYGALYRLLGGEVRVDRDKKTVSAPLVSDGVDSGVRLEIRSGGPAADYTPAVTHLYLDDEVMLGGVDTDQAVRFSARQPTQAVFAVLEKSPLMLMWDPATHPDLTTIEDIGRSGNRVLYLQGSTYMEYLIDAGLLHREQADASYDGTPARFVAENGAPVQQGYVTNEVFQYEQELPQWKRKVAWRLVSDSGYPSYPETLAIRPDRKAALAPCLTRFVPMLQRATAGYLADPASTNTLLVRLVKEFGAFPYSAERAAYAASALRDNGLMGVGSGTAVGDFDPGRVQRTIDILTPILRRQHQEARDGLSAADVFTNEFIDQAIGSKD